MKVTAPPYTVEDALEGIMSLLNPGPYGVSAEDPKQRLIRDLGDLTRDLAVTPVIIGGVAVIVNGYPRQTVDVDLLVARGEALRLIRRLEASPHFSKLRLDRFRHTASGAGLDLCVEGEKTSPHHEDRFPSPAAVEKVPRAPLPVAGLLDLLALKVKSARARDEADFIALFQARGLTAEDVGRIKKNIEDPELRDLADRWHARASEEAERERSRRLPDLG